MFQTKGQGAKEPPAWALRRGLGAGDTGRWKVLPSPSFEPFCILATKTNAWHGPLKTFLKPLPSCIHSVLLFLQAN